MVENMKTDLRYDFLRLTNHNFLSSFKICHDILVLFIINIIMFIYQRLDYLKTSTAKEVKDFVLN